jgi:TPP-dependent trihydroxycyclohexane-1,2-dione (THcHDO) dehydratase
MSTVRCTMAQALVRYLCNQFTIVDGEQVPLFPGVFAIFGHGNVTCLSEALEAVRIPCRLGAGRTSNRWRSPQSASQRPSGGVRSW